MLNLSVSFDKKDYQLMQFILCAIAAKHSQGERTSVTITDAQSGEQYHLPVEVAVWHGVEVIAHDLPNPRSKGDKQTAQDTPAFSPSLSSDKTKIVAHSRK